MLGTVPARTAVRMDCGHLTNDVGRRDIIELIEFCNEGVRLGINVIVAASGLGDIIPIVIRSRGDNLNIRICLVYRIEEHWKSILFERLPSFRSTSEPVFVAYLNILKLPRFRVAKLCTD